MHIEKELFWTLLKHGQLFALRLKIDLGVKILKN